MLTTGPLLRDGLERLQGLAAVFERALCFLSLGDVFIGLAQFVRRLATIDPSATGQLLLSLGSTGLELSDAAKASITLPFIPVWTVLGVLNGLAFLGAKEKSA